jgi:effector-binding domain-containing protein
MKISQEKFPASTYFGITHTIKILNMPSTKVFEETYPKVWTFMDENKIELSGPAVSIYKEWNPESGMTVLMPAFPAKAPQTLNQNQLKEAGIEKLELKESSALIAIHKGAYEGLAQAHQDMIAELKEKDLTSSLTIEEYSVMADQTEDEKDYETRLIYILG